MTTMRFSRLLPVLVAATAALLSSPCAAAVPGLHALVAPSDRGVAADVATVRDMRDIRDFGSMAATKPVEIGLLLRVRNETQLQSLILAQGKRTSPYFHKYLSSAQFDQYFAPSQATYARTIATLRRRGFRVTQTLANRTMIRATAGAGIVDRYFNTRIHAVYQKNYGYRYMNVTPAIMPAELRNDVVSVSGLHSIVAVNFPIHFGDKAAIARSAQYIAARERLKTRGRVARATPHVMASHAPIGTSTPGPPGPDPTESPEDADTDYVTYYGYGPPIYTEGYDYPVHHGYGGKGFAAGSVISNDYLDSDAAIEYKTFNIPRTGTTNPLGYRVCTDPAPTANCDGLIGAGDPEGESTLDALTILSLAPAADFYEYLAPNLNDIGIEFAYERAVNDNVVSVLNSSFGACETSDPSFEYSTNYIAMEGAALGITFSASAGDTGAYSCGVYASNGPPQTERDISTPAGDTYFTDVGGTSYLIILPTDTNDYDMETPWLSGGGGYSAYEPMTTWQAPLQAQSSALALTSATYRNTPDVAMCADPGTNPDGFVGGYTGVSEVITHNGTLTPAGGTSLASPMWVAMQTEIDEVQNSRNGFVDPALDAIAATSTAEYTFAFNDLTVGTNLYYPAETGMDDSSGIGSPKGWEIAGAPEYGTPGAPAQPLTTPGPTAEPTLAPVSTATPHPVGTNFAVTTIVAKTCTSPGSSIDNASGEAACVANPTGIQYVAAATAANSAGQADPEIFFTDFTTGYLRGYDVTSTAVQTFNNKTWSNAGVTSSAKLSNLYGLGYLSGSTDTSANGLYVAGNGTLSLVTLPATAGGNATPTSPVDDLGNTPTGIAFNPTGTTGGTVDASDTDFNLAIFAATEDTENGTANLPTGGNYGIVYAGAATLPEFAFTNDGFNEVEGVLAVPLEAMVVNIYAGTPLNRPKGITYLSTPNAYYVANCGGNDIIRIDGSTMAATVVAGDGAAKETDGDNTGAEFSCPYGITNDGTNLYVTDTAGNAIREIKNVI
jgi:kumamolisin